MTLSPSEVKDSLELFELKPGELVRMEVLKDLLPDASTALFFGKVYALDYQGLSRLLSTLFQTTVVQTLLGEGDSHSTELQDYIIDVVPPAELMSAGILPSSFTEAISHEFLPELFEQLNVEIAASITQLINTLGGTIAMFQGKQGKMLFQTLHTLNKQRQNTIGQYKATIVHPAVEKNLVILDVSSSVSETTVRKIAEEVVALAYSANAALAIVSNTTSLWEPGTYSVDDVLARAEFGGTHYETLVDVFQEDWATVIGIADFDSGGGVPGYLKKHCKGRIAQYLDVSLVNKHTYLSVCLGQLADKVTPLLVGNSNKVLGGYGHTEDYTPYDEQTESSWFSYEDCNYGV